MTKMMETNNYKKSQKQLEIKKRKKFKIMMFRIKKITYYR